MEYILGIIILVVLGKVFVKILPVVWYVFLFVAALIVLLFWLVILESSGLGVVLGVFGTIGSAWGFVKKIRNRRKRLKP
jgi:hypothetical protein